MAGLALDHGGVPTWIEPMLAKPAGQRLPSGSDWAFEYKLDGYRAAVRVAADGTTVLTSRNGIDFTDEFVSLVGVLDEALDGRAAVFDGEIVTYNDSGLVDFGLMRCVSRFLRQVGQGFIESIGGSGWVSVSSGLLIQTAVGRAGGSGCLRTNRSGLRV
jgi:YD repeat-containing protein